LELHLGRFPGRAGRFDALARGIEGGGGIEDFRDDLFAKESELGLRLPLCARSPTSAARAARFPIGIWKTTPARTSSNSPSPRVANGFL
jgi:hypothetical protein